MVSEASFARQAEVCIDWSSFLSLVGIAGMRCSIRVLSAFGQ